jgi:hypothetical protein
MHASLLQPRSDRWPGGTRAGAHMLLFEDVTRRVPMAAAYVGDAVRQGRKLVFDHGALRTVVATDNGALPPARKRSAACSSRSASSAAASTRSIASA